MSKKNKIIYWITTLWLSLGMVSTGIVQIIKMEEEVLNFHKLGYPTYLMTLIGIAKMLGVTAILIPKFPILKEWAYAGFTYTMMGAIISHIVVQDEVSSFFGPTLLLVLTFISRHFRPESRKIV